jgi:hypothetical protein
MHDVVTIDRIDVYPRQDTCCPERLTNFRISVHLDDHGQIGGETWSADLFTDGTNPGAAPGIVVDLTRDLHPTGEFKGQWIRILSLEDPVQDYALQMTEVEVIGTIQARPVLTLSRSVAGFTLSWTEGVLEAADGILGPWNAVAQASSPFQVEPSGALRFYRLRR